jgi:hypothetical protein
MTADTPHLDVILSQAPIISVGHDGRSADLGKAESELSALKARVEAAEKEVSERGKDVSMLTSYLRHAVMCGDPYGNCWTCTKARELLTRIDAALQAAREA